MEENKINLPFPSSSPSDPSPMTPHSDQNPTPMLGPSIDHETPQLFSSFFSGDWMNSIILEESPIQENSLTTGIKEKDDVIHTAGDLHPRGIGRRFETEFPRSSDAQIGNNLETMQFYSPSSTLSMDHDNDLFLDHPIGSYTSLLLDVANFDSDQMRSYVPMVPSPRTNLSSPLPSLPPLSSPQTLQFSSPSTSSTTHNDSSAIPTVNNYYCNMYTGLLSDVVTFNRPISASNVPTLSPSVPSTLPLPPMSHKSLKTKERSNGWSKFEHRLFIAGMTCFGQGNWKDIAEKVVMTRSYKQVASHAQKFFLRQTLPYNKRKRSSIHDITTVDPQFLSQVRSRLSLPNLVSQSNINGSN